jgi:hypothetical protein
MRSGKPDVSSNDLYSQSAIYVAAAHALKPNYSVLVYVIFFLVTACCFIFACKKLENRQCFLFV